MRTRRTSLVVVAVALAILAGSEIGRVQASDRASLSAGQVTSPAAPTIQVYSRETVVDVTVLDKGGKPVHGLRQSDFSVLEDGKPEAIRSFEESGMVTQAARVPEPVEKLPPNTYSNRENAAAAGPLNLIVMDAVNMGMADEMRAKEEATDYIRKMPAGTQVALLRLGASLQIVQGFTTDREVQVAALNDMKNTVMPPGMTEPCLRAMAPRLTALGLRAAGALLNGAKGRKTVLWFTGDLMNTPGNGASCGSPAKRIELEKAMELLAAARVTVYAIDAGGLRAPVMSAEFGDNTPRMMHPAAGYGGRWLEDNVVGPSGGRTFRGSNDFQAEMAKAIELGSNYYTLSYAPAHGNDGIYHHIVVKLDRPGLELMYRPGYGAEDIAKVVAETGVFASLDATTPEPSKNTVVASMQRFAPPATQLLFDARVAASTTPPGPTDAATMGFPVAQVKDKPMARYDLLYSLAPSQIAFSDGPDGVYRGAVEFDITVSDVFGKLITSVSRTMPLTFDAEEYAEFVKVPFQFFQQIDLPAGQAYIRAGVLDKISNKVGTVDIPLKIAKPAPKLNATAGAPAARHDR